MRHTHRKHSRFALALVALIALGLGSRSPGMPPLVVLYVGDVLWGSLFFVLGALLRPADSSLRIGIGSLLLAELIECSQLYQAPWAEAVRATRIGGLLLGHSFLWSDLLCNALGASLALFTDAALSRRGSL